MSQLALDGLIAAAGLTDRQTQALAIVREHGPLPSEELGRRLREARGGRSSGEQWDASNGRGVAEALRHKGLVRRVRGKGWVVDWAAEPEPSSQLGPNDPWPEGF